MGELQTLKKIVRDIVSKYEEQMKSLEKEEDSSIVSKLTTIEFLRSDINNILDVDIQFFKDILEEIDIDSLEKETICKYLYSIKTLLLINKDKNTTYEISDEQKSYYDSFFKLVDDKLMDMEDKKEEAIDKLKYLKEPYQEYKTLFNKIEHIEDNHYVDDMDLINKIFNELQLDENTKRTVLFEIMRYNQKVFNKNMKLSPKNRVNIVEELDSISKRESDYLDIHEFEE